MSCNCTKEDCESIKFLKSAFKEKLLRDGDYYDIDDIWVQMQFEKFLQDLVNRYFDS